MNPFPSASRRGSRGPRPHAARLPWRAGLAVLGVAVVGCASTQLDAEWRDPQAAQASLRGTRVLVSCQAAETVLAQICKDRLSAALSARGVTPLVADDAAGEPLQAARTAGATSVIQLQLSVADARTESPVSVGIGGFGFGGGNFGGGLGIGFPIGGGRTQVGYAADSRLSEASTGRLLWTARARSPASSDLTAQVDALVNTVVAGAERAGYF